MTDEELQARTEAIDAELEPLDTACRLTAIRAWLLMRCDLCKRGDVPIARSGYCHTCIRRLNNRGHEQ